MNEWISNQWGNLAPPPLINPAGPIRTNLSSEESNCFHYNSMMPFAAGIMEYCHWWVKTIVSLCCIAAGTEGNHGCFSRAWMKGGYTFCRSVFADILTIYSLCHVSYYWWLHRLVVEQGGICFSPSCFLIDYFLLCIFTMISLSHAELQSTELYTPYSNWCTVNILWLLFVLLLLLLLLLTFILVSRWRYLI